jgi:hypothetical protein
MRQRGRISAEPQLPGRSQLFAPESIHCFNAERVRAHIEENQFLLGGFVWLEPSLGMEVKRELPPC